MNITAIDSSAMITPGNRGVTEDRVKLLEPHRRGHHPFHDRQQYRRPDQRYQRERLTRINAYVPIGANFAPI